MEQITFELTKLLERTTNEGDCIVWTGFRDKDGYGSTYDPRDQKSKRAHRLSYELAKGTIPDGLYVLHQCDNPPCINPEHLEVGTPSDNTKQAASRGRFGSARHTKLTDDQVREIRLLLEDGVSRQEIAKRFSVSVTAVFNIAHNRTWKEVK